MDPNSVDILLVEDNVDDAELTIRELKRHRLLNNLVHLKDGEQALDFIFATGRFAGIRDIAFCPRVILLDIQMPKVNGIEVLQRIKVDPRTKTIPVVVLTSSNQDPDIRTCYNMGVNSYIVKPVNFDRFAQAIQSIGLYWLLINKTST